MVIGNFRLNIFITFFVFLSITFISVGYAALNTELTISGEVVVMPDYEYGITNIEIVEFIDGAYETYNSTFTNNMTELNVSLPNNTSRAVFKVSFNNKNATNLYLENIIVHTNTNVDINWSLNNITESTVIPIGSSSFEIELFYDNNTSVGEEIELSLEYVFSQSYLYKESILNGSHPVIADGMVPVTFDNLGNVYKADVGSEWYDYESNRWANVVLLDEVSRSSYMNAGSGTLINGSDIVGYFVWIPRYEYNLVESSKDITINFISKYDRIASSNYRIHPSFVDGSNSNYMNGEWDEEIAGFWVSKFPAGYQGNAITNNNGTLSTTLSNSGDTIVYSDVFYSNDSPKSINVFGQNLAASGYRNEKISYPVFNPLTYSYNNISFGDIYTITQSIDSATDFYGLTDNTIDSHMVKNSEWGALAYLTWSSYGTNKIEPNMNNYYTSHNSPFRGNVTGVYTNASTASSTANLSAMNVYYTSIGLRGSSTLNITGVYDMVGGMTERVAAYIARGASIMTENGASFVYPSMNANGYLTLSTKYVTVYPFASNYATTSSYTTYTSLSNSLYNYGYGDAILEVSASSSNTGTWNSDRSAYTSYFFIRSLYYGMGANSGIFAFDLTDGQPWNWDGYRTILTPLTN